MELLIKCTALALFSAVSALLIRRVNPELSLAISVDEMKAVSGMARTIPMLEEMPLIVSSDMNAVLNM